MSRKEKKMLLENFFPVFRNLDSVETGREGELLLNWNTTITELKARLLDFADAHEWVLNINVEMAHKNPGRRPLQYEALRADRLRAIAEGLGCTSASDAEILNFLSRAHVIMMQMGIGNSMLAVEDRQVRKLAMRLIENGFFSEKKFVKGMDYFNEGHTSLIRFEIMDSIVSLSHTASVFEEDILELVDQCRLDNNHFRLSIDRSPN